ncbi:MAG: Rnf-Nqr domain containing protein [Gammaproteobacteria bacterium]
MPMPAAAARPVYRLRDITTRAALRDNVATVRMLALCPMLAVSVSLGASATLGLITALVMAISGAAVALVRGQTPDAVRLPVFLVIVAAIVGAADVIVAAASPEMHRRLDIYLPLVITNCAVLARLELFARNNPPVAAAVDGLFAGLGMAVVLCALAFLREGLGRGEVLGLAFASPPLPSALLPAAGFMLFGLFIALLRLIKQPSAQ